jgi:hypothetical protein
MKTNFFLENQRTLKINAHDEMCYLTLKQMGYIVTTVL